jgi:hypothetical protein
VTPKGFCERVNGTSVPLKIKKYSVWIHSALLAAAELGTAEEGTYQYRVGNYVDAQKKWMWSPWYNFTLPNLTQPFTLAVFGDMGVTSHAKTTMQLLTTTLHTNQFDAALVMGDLSYANGDPKVWDEWGTLISPVARHRLWLTVVGNHEREECCGELFMEYRTRFMLPLYYSLDLSFMHLTVLNSEDDIAPGSSQYKWLEEDLRIANQNRAHIPWLVVTSHKPLYCTNTKYCDSKSLMKRRAALEPLFQKFQVDLYISGHVHAYERTYPLHNTTIDQKRGILYLVVGSMW